MLSLRRIRMVQRKNLDGNSDSGNDGQNSSQGTNDKTHDSEDIKENLVNINTADVEGLTSIVRNWRNKS